MYWYYHFCEFLLLILGSCVIFRGFKNRVEFRFLDYQHTVIVKGIGILLVMLGHSMQYFAPEITYFTPTGGIGVAMFLFSSGYGLCESYLKKGNLDFFWKRRIGSVVFPYFIFQILTYWPFHSFSLLSFILDVTCIKPLHIYGWYLRFILFWYIVFFIVFKVKVLNKYKMMCFCTVAILVFVLMKPLLAEQAISFFWGVFWSVNKEKLTFLRKLRYGVYCVLFGALFLCLKQIPLFRTSPELVYKLLQLLIKVLPAIGLIIIVYSVQNFFSLQPIKLLGTISFELYLCHGLILNLFTDSPGRMMLFIMLSVICSSAYYFVYKSIKNLFSGRRL